MYCLNQFCCICLIKKDNLQELSNNTESNSYYNKLVICIPQMDFNTVDDVFLICEECIKQIDQIYDFRELCLKNNETLKNYLSQRSLKRDKSYNINLNNKIQTIESLNGDTDIEKIYVKEEPRDDIEYELNDNSFDSKRLKEFTDTNDTLTLNNSNINHSEGVDPIGDEIEISDNFKKEYVDIKHENVECNETIELQQTNLHMKAQVIRNNNKLTRNTITLETKIHILDRLKNGERIMVIAKSLDLNESTIRSIKKNEHKIRNAVSIGSSMYRNMVRYRTPIIEKMESTLCYWIEDCRTKGVQLNHKFIRQKALEIYNNLKENGELSVTPDFVASNGWLERFKKRFSIPYIGSIPKTNKKLQKYQDIDQDNESLPIQPNTKKKRR